MQQLRGPLDVAHQEGDSAGRPHGFLAQGVRLR
jgi:hypothetical protein